jgi:hypothetical protein
MYATVRHYHLDHDDHPGLLKHLADGFIDQLAGIPGFVSYAVMTDATGQVYSMTVCEDEASCERSTELAAAWHQSELGGAMIELHNVATGPVVTYAAQPAGAPPHRRSSSTP